MKTRAIQWTLGLGLVLGATAACAEPEGEAARTRLRPAREAGWELAFRDEFNREELGDAWQIIDGNWALEEEALVGSGTIVSRRGYPDDSWGFTRLEFEVETAVQPFVLLPGGPPPAVQMCDLSSFIHARPPDKVDDPYQPWRGAGGYFFQFGGSMNTINRIRRAGQELVAERDTRIVPDERYRIVVENDEGALRIFVNDELLMEVNDPNPFPAGNDYNRVGFYFVTRARLHNVRVYIRRLDDMDHFI